MDKVLETRDFKVENKKFFFDLKENPKGRYLRITESSGGRSSISGSQELLGRVLDRSSSFMLLLRTS